MGHSWRTENLEDLEKSIGVVKHEDHYVDPVNAAQKIFPDFEKNISSYKFQYLITCIVVRVVSMANINMCLD